MKILLVTLEYPPFKGGVAHYYQHLVKYFPGPICLLADNHDGPPDEPAVGAPLINHHLPMYKWLGGLPAIWCAVRENKPDCLVAGQILPLGLPLWLASRLFKKPLVIILHGYDYSISQRQPRKKKLSEWLIRQAKLVICANHYTAEMVRANLESSAWGKIKVVNPGIEAKVPAYDEAAIKALKARHNLGDKKIILTVGRLVRRKGMDVVLRALPQILAAEPTAHYVIIGDGPDKKYLQELIKELKLSKNVSVLTDVDQAEKTLWYQAAEVFVMTPRNLGGDFEGFGIVYLEAGLAGKPVVAGASGGVTDAVVGEQTGLIVNPESAPAVAEAVIKLLTYPGLAQRLGQAGRERALREFDWKNQARKIYNLLEIL